MRVELSCSVAKVVACALEILFGIPGRSSVQGGVGVVGHFRERTMRRSSAACILLRRDTTPFVHRSQHLLLQPAAAAGPASMPRCIETQAVM
ncbi:unnamed protein product [Sphagnum tenellum]